MATKELSSAPGMRTLYPRAVMGSARKVPVIGPLIAGGGSELPDEELVLPEVEIDREHLMEYDRVCGIPFGDEVPTTYPHIVAFPLAMQLMTDRSFPFPVIGMVHIENQIERIRPIQQQEWLTMRVRADDLRPHDKGTQFDIVAEASVGEEPVWRERSTYLHKSGGSGGEKKKNGARPPEPRETWDIPGDIGRAYAAVSGDRNPIHMHPLSARLFGMPGAIAHGMWLKARCLAELRDDLPEGSYAVSARFMVPLKIPATVAFSTQQGGAFAVHDAESGKPHLVGRFS
jgi:hypothetical protein